MLKIKDKMTHKEAALALEAARLKGLFGKTMCFPAAGREGEEAVPESFEALNAWAKKQAEAAGGAAQSGPGFSLRRMYRTRRSLR